MPAVYSKVHMKTRYEHVTLNKELVPSITGTTMKVVELVVEQQAYGWSPEELHFQHPYLTFGGEETLTDFLAKNREQHPVGSDLNPGGRLVCVGDEEFDNIFRDRDGWDRFRQEFPESDGTLRFSRVGLDRDVTQAMLCAGQQFDWNIGSGSFWLFSKLDGEWTEAGRLGNWIS
jgi:hypothetical protein